MGTGGTTQLSSLDILLNVMHIQNYTEEISMSNILVLAVNVIQSSTPFRLDSWDVFAYGLLPNHFSLSLEFLDRPAKLSPRFISIGPLHALRHFHSQPIYLVFFKESYWITP